jgi:hypothetical protein
MRRILMVLSVAALMAAIMVTSAMPAFANHGERHGFGGQSKVTSCSKLTCEWERGGGGAGLDFIHPCEPAFKDCITRTGGGGGVVGGGGGHRSAPTSR